jgi:lambda family phage portal protein
MPRATWLDRVIGWASPETAARRLRARAQIDVLARGYAGAALGRNTDGWRVSSTSADAEIEKAGRRLRDRSRDLDRNNPHAAKAASLHVGNIVGEGIMPRAATGDPKKDAKVMKAFEKWAKQCDADGQLDFYGLQSVAVRGMVVGGEMLARRRRRRSGDGLAVPVQIQLIEPDYLDDTKNGALSSGAKAVQGVEFDAIGRRTAYWLYREHPGNSFALNLTSSRVPASEIAHLYEKQRQQTRGVPWSAPVIRRIRDIDDYDFAEGIRKKIEASTVAFVTGHDDSDVQLTSDGQNSMRVEDGHGNLVEKFAPGLIAYLRGGKDVRFNQPATVGGYEDYKRVTAREVAAGFRVPYALLTGDGSQENFSAQRGLINQFRRDCSIAQWQIVIPMLLDPWWSWFTEAAYAAGEIDDPVVAVEWSPPKWIPIEPYKDAMADLITLRLGTRSWFDVVSERGRNPQDVMTEIKQFADLVDKLDLVLDCDPRKTTLAGVLQKLVTDAGVEPPQVN